MKVFRLSGSPSLATRSAEMMVPWMTSRSMPADQQPRRQRLGVLRAHPHRGRHPGLADAGHRRGQQLGIQRRSVQLLQQPDGRRRLGFFGSGLGDLSDLGGHVRVPADQPFAVEHSQTAEPAELDGEFRRHQRIGRMSHDGDLEAVRVELPRRRHVLRGAGAP